MTESEEMMWDERREKTLITIVSRHLTRRTEYIYWHESLLCSGKKIRTEILPEEGQLDRTTSSGKKSWGNVRLRSTNYRGTRFDCL